MKCAIRCLIDWSRFENAIILNLIYNLAISPRTIYYLLFDNLNSQKFLKYYDWDYDIFKETQISIDLYNDLKFFQRYQTMKMKNRHNDTRTTKSGLELKGNFIVNQTQKNIYMHMKRQYEGKLTWFIWTSKLIIRSSIHNKINYHQNHIN